MNNSNEKSLWWCGWDVPDGLPPDDMVEFWHNNMQGWITGSGDGYTTYAGGVITNSAEEAWLTVLACYGNSADKINSRWEPIKRDNGWIPSDRFQGFNLVVPMTKG